MFRRAFEPFNRPFHAETGDLVIGIDNEKGPGHGTRKGRTAETGAQICNDRAAVFEDRHAGEDRRAERQVVERRRAGDGRDRVLPHTIRDAADIEHEQIWHRVQLGRT